MYVFANVMFYLLSSNNIRTKKSADKTLCIRSEVFDYLAPNIRVKPTPIEA